MFGRRNRASAAPRTRLLFVSDLHGSETTFAKLLRVLELWSPDVLVVGGDVAGKGLWPVIVDNGRRRFSWMGEEHEASADAYAAVRRSALQVGYYPLELPAGELERVQADPEARDAAFDALMRERWADWLARLDARCAELGVHAFVMAGNDDPWSLDDLTSAEREWVRGADGKVLPLLEDGSWTLLTCGLANQTPWQCPRDVTEDELAAALDALAAGVPDFGTTIANIHVPPRGFGLDLAAELDTSVDPPRPVFGSQAPVGSSAVAAFLRARQPAVSLHGHIHESGGAAAIGRTRAFNPGSEYGEGILRGVLVTLRGRDVLGHQFVSG
ncbi:MAG TPA: metallophosphoesterase [Solirubrobacter sp.]|nr:metallophosphoesterase [Solirubrobacter sp.]